MTNTNNKSSLREAFVHKAAEMVGTGIYVWGGNGELLDAMPDPIGWIERHEADAKNAARAVKLLERRRRDGIRDIRAFDCSGLVYWALKELGVLKNDVSSRGLYALCKPIDENALLPGDLVFHHDGKQIVHVGICVGMNRSNAEDATSAWCRTGESPATGTGSEGCPPWRKAGFRQTF